MKLLILLSSIILPFAAAEAYSQSVQNVSATILKNELIMKAPPFKACHASTIVELKKNRFMAAWFGGTAEGQKDACIWMSVANKGRWNEPFIIADGKINDSLRYPCWNPVLFKTHQGRLFLFYKVGPSPRQWWGVMRFSDNDGKKWSEPERLPGTMLGPIKNKPIQLSSGDILYPSSTESLDARQWLVHLEKSDPEARNWTSIPVNCDSFAAIQPSILSYPGDRLQILCRSRQNALVQAWSTDNGATWSPLTKTSLPNPNSGTDAITLKNNLQVLVYNPLTRGRQWHNGRQKLSVAVSTDGLEWKDVLQLENNERGEYSYPAIIQDRKGIVHITYTADRKNIRHVMVNVKKL